MEFDEVDKFLKVWGLGSCSQSPSAVNFAWIALAMLAAVVAGVLRARWS